MAGWERVLAHWMLNGTSDVDITGMNIDRFRSFQSATRITAANAPCESLGMVYKAHYPDQNSMETARGAKKSPFHDRLAAQGAYFREASGWESPGMVCAVGT